MFISKQLKTAVMRCEAELDQIDPYALLRIVFYKALFIATLLVWVYWWFKPMSFSAFIAPILLASLYDMPNLVNVKEKDLTLVFVFTAFIIGSISFYLIYPFKFVFLYYAIAFLTALFFLFQRFLPKLKNISLFIITLSTLCLTTTPTANFQIVYNFFISSMLTILTLFAGLKCFPNYYLLIWCRGIQQFIKCLETQIETTQNTGQKNMVSMDITHLSMISAAKRMIPKKYLINTSKIAINLRNIQFAFDNITAPEATQEFWTAVLKQLQLIRTSMKNRTICTHRNIPTSPTTQLQNLVSHYLEITTKRWNKLCAMLVS